MTVRKLIWCMCFVAFVFHGVISAQEKVRVVSDVKPFPGQPLQIVSKTVGGNRLDLEGRVFAGQDWLKDFRIEFKNISRKNVTYVSINLEIAATGTMVYPLVVPIIYRASEDPSVIAKHQNSLLPGQVTSVGVVYYPQALVRLRSLGVHDVTNATMSIRQVEFDDNTAWYLGVENRRDPLNPDKWIVVSRPPKFFH